MNGTNGAEMTAQEERRNAILGEVEGNAKLEAVFGLGGISTAKRIADQITLQTIKALAHFRENKGHERLGYKNFKEFLEESEFSPMSKNQYYEKKSLLDKEGESVFELLEDVGVPNRQRKEVEAGEILIEGDKVIVGDEETDLSDLPRIKELIKDLSDRNRELSNETQSNKSKIEDLEETIKTGRDEYEDLNRRFDAFKNNDPVSNTTLKALTALAELKAVVSETPENIKELKGEEVFEALWELVQELRDELLLGKKQLIDTAVQTDIDPDVLSVIEEVEQEDSEDE